MGQQTRLELKKHQEKIVNLEAELERTYRTINDLQQENHRLREELIRVKSFEKQSATQLQSEVPLTSAGILSPNHPTSPYRLWEKPTPIERLGRLPFAVKVAAIVCAIVFGGWVVMQLTSRQTSAPSAPESLPGSSYSEPSKLRSRQELESSSPSSTIANSGDRKPHLNLTYNVKKSPPLQASQNLQAIVNEAVNLADIQGLPTDTLSITLIDVKTNQIAAYQQDILRYPASVAKLFWMVALYAQIENKILPAQAAFYTPECKSNICKMIEKSDNEAASRIVDRLTDTTSSQLPLEENYHNWLEKRQWLNHFFQAAGYKNINISQKNFPIPYLKMDGPQGLDLKMRGNPDRPIRNKMSTEQAARLMYEIFNGQAVSPKASQQMMQLLKRDLRPEVWQQEQYNSVEGFFSEFLPFEEIHFSSKVGWTATSRQEVAYITTKDDKTAYILAIFGDDPAYGNDWKIFPELSRLIYNRMTNR